MQCPKCQYEPTMAEHQASPEQCPSCGVYYAKVRSAGGVQTGQVADKQLLEKVSAGVSAARATIAEARDIRRADQDERETIRRASSPIHGEVIVVDIDMPFWSMVQLMVKLAVAAIPAAIIIFIIFSLPAFIGSVMTSYAKYGK